MKAHICLAGMHTAKGKRVSLVLWEGRCGFRLQDVLSCGVRLHGKSRCRAGKHRLKRREPAIEIIPHGANCSIAAAAVLPFVTYRPYARSKIGLFVADRFHRIEGGGAPRGQVARKQTHGNEQHADRRKEHRVRGSGAQRQRSHHARGRISGSQADG